jgi:hypothetical protein
VELDNLVQLEAAGLGMEVVEVVLMVVTVALL